MKQKFLAVVLLLFLYGCAANTGNILQATNENSNDQRECVKNFATTGSFMVGKTYYTTEFVNGVTKDQALERAKMKLVSEGDSIISFDRDGGVIVAGFDAQQSPATVAITGDKGGVNVAISYNPKLKTVVLASESTVNDYFCGIISAIRNGK